MLDLMPKSSSGASKLRALREATGISQRELARQIDERQSNVSFWERSGVLPRSDKLAPIAAALGVTVEQLLGEDKPKRVLAPGGRLRQVFERASKLSRAQQAKVAEFVEAFVERQEKAV
ncbi:MAG: helix-turn-helix domain-containing protein [Opitutaceae bacterium]